MKICIGKREKEMEVQEKEYNFMNTFCTSDRPTYTYLYQYVNINYEAYDQNGLLYGHETRLIKLS